MGVCLDTRAKTGARAAISAGPALSIQGRRDGHVRAMVSYLSPAREHRAPDRRRHSLGIGGASALVPDSNAHDVARETH
jgi:hypothetical protein